MVSTIISHFIGTYYLASQKTIRHDTNFLSQQVE